MQVLLLEFTDSMEGWDIEIRTTTDVVLTTYLCTSQEQFPLSQ